MVLFSFCNTHTHASGASYSPVQKNEAPWGAYNSTHTQWQGIWPVRFRPCCHRQVLGRYLLKMGTEKTYMICSSCKNLKLECVEVCMKVSTALLLKGVLYVLLGFWDWCHKEYQKTVKQKPPSLHKEHKILERGKMS